MPSVRGRASVSTSRLDVPEPGAEPKAGGFDGSGGQYGQPNASEPPEPEPMPVRWVIITGFSTLTAVTVANMGDFGAPAIVGTVVGVAGLLHKIMK